VDSQVVEVAISTSSSCKVVNLAFLWIFAMVKLTSARVVKDFALCVSRVTSLLKKICQERSEAMGHLLVVQPLRIRHTN